MFFTSWPDFIRVWPGLIDFTGFQVLNPILHVLCILTRKIGDYTSQNLFLTTMLHTHAFLRGAIKTRRRGVPRNILSLKARQKSYEKGLKKM